MRVTIHKKDLETAISTASRAISSKSPLPILSHFLVVAETGSLRITATDLEIGIEYSMNANVIEEGSFTTPAATFKEIVSLMPDADLHVKKENEELEITAPHSSYKLMTLPPDEFPLIPHFEDKPDIVMSQKKLKDMIRNTIFACASQEETRAVLTGILSITKGKYMEFIATDGRRLAKMKQEIKNEVSGEKKLIMPGRALNEISKFLKDTDDDVKIMIKSGQVFFEMENIFMLSRILEGKFPQFEQVIPESTTIHIKVERQKLFMAMKRALIMAQEKQNPKLVRMNLEKDKIILRSYTPDLGSAYEEIDASVKGEGLDIAFNGNYFLDALSHMQVENLEFDLSTNESPGVIRPEGWENYIYVVMPVRIKEEMLEEEYAGQ